MSILGKLRNDTLDTLLFHCVLQVTGLNEALKDMDLPTNIPGIDTVVHSVCK